MPAVLYGGLVLRTGWTEVVAPVAAYLIAALATPAGISGAVPGALYRYRRQGQTGGRHALVLIAGTAPGVIAGSVIRV